MKSDTQTTLSLLQSSSLSDVVQQSLETSILSGEYAGGTKLNEVVLAEKLGVSRGPIREAFRMLDESGLVRTEKNRGVFVREIPIEDAIEIFNIRAALEEMVGRQLASQIGKEHLNELNERLSAMNNAVHAQDINAYHQINLSFHDRLVEMTGNAKLLAIYRKLIKELTLFRRLNLEDEQALPDSANEHITIIKAIASGDRTKAGKVLYDHVEKSKLRTVAKHAQKAKVKATLVTEPQHLTARLGPS